METLGEILRTHRATDYVTQDWGQNLWERVAGSATEKRTPQKENGDELLAMDRPTLTRQTVETQRVRQAQYGAYGVVVLAQRVVEILELLAREVVER